MLAELLFIGMPTSKQSAHPYWHEGSRFAKHEQEASAMNKLIPIAGTRMCEYKYVAPRSISSKIITVVKTLARDCFIAIGVRHG